GDQATDEESCDCCLGHDCLSLELIYAWPSDLRSSLRGGDRRIGRGAPNVSLRGESHGDDDRPSGMSVSDMSQRLRSSIQGERAVDDRRDLPGFDECLQRNQVLAVLSLDRRGQLPALDL